MKPSAAAFQQAAAAAAGCMQRAGLAENSGSGRAGRGGGNPEQHRVSAMYFNTHTQNIVTATNKMTLWHTRSSAKANKTERSHGPEQP